MTELRRINEGDRDFFISLQENEKVTRGTGRSLPASELFDYYIDREYSYIVLYEGKKAGFAAFYRNSMTDSFEHLKIAEVTYALMPEQWGRGIGTEAMDLLLKEAGKAGFDCVLAGAFTDNPASGCILRKKGIRIFSRFYGDREEEIFLITQNRY